MGMQRTSGLVSLARSAGLAGMVSWAGLTSVAGLAGCLEGGEVLVSGRSIMSGREPRRPTLVRAADDLYVVYETLKPEGTPNPESPRLWAIPYRGGEPRKLAENGAWPVTREDAGSVLVLHDLDPRSEQPPQRWFPQTAAALTRMDLATGQALADFPLIVDFGFWQGRLFVETAAEGGPLRRLSIDQAGGLVELAPAADIEWSQRGEMFVLLANPAPARPDSGMLVRLRSPADMPEPLASGVSQFMLHPSGDLLLGRSRVAGGRDEAWLLELGDVARAPVELPADCGWLAFVPNTHALVCVHARAGGESSELHVIDLDTRADRGFPIASRDPGRLEVEWTRDGTVALVREPGRAWLLRPAAEPAVMQLGPAVYHPIFSPDGGAIAYIDVGAGADGINYESLMVQDTALTGPARSLTVTGSFIQSYSFNEDGSGLFDVTHFGDYKASLHFTDLRSGDRRLIADGIGWWIWRWNRGTVVVEPQVVTRGSRVLLVDDWSEQDRVGVLRLVDLGAHTDRVLARGVAGFGVEAPCRGCGLLDPGAPLVVAVSARAPSAQDGLWALALPY
jgi:hypothetical protein